MIQLIIIIALILILAYQQYKIVEHSDKIEVLYETNRTLLVATEILMKKNREERRNNKKVQFVGDKNKRKIVGMKK